VHAQVQRLRGQVVLLRHLRRVRVRVRVRLRVLLLVLARAGGRVGVRVRVSSPRRASRSGWRASAASRRAGAPCSCGAPRPG
jgi:hypothetical protein